MSGGGDPDKEDASTERWLVSYADFITLMFAFFAVLYATSQKDAEKTKEFQESIKRYLIKAGAFGDTGGQINQGQKNTSVIEPPIQTFTPGKPETVATLDEAEAFVESQLSKEERKKFIIDVVADDWGVRLILPANILYADGSEKFREGALPFLGKLGALVSKTRRKILVEGHVGPNEMGHFKSTWDFASARAVTLVRYLEKREKLPAAQFASASLGDSRPLYKTEKTDLNSRVEIVLLNQEFEF